MARRKDKEKAIALRSKGWSYSQIKTKTGISKSTLSGWLADMPLPKERVYELQKNEGVIEKIRAAKNEKRAKRLNEVYARVSKDLGALSDREFLIAGFFLYWAEGGKTTKYSISLSNTDPSMIRAYLRWLKLLKIPSEKVIIRLHLYSDMDPGKEIKYWSNTLELPRRNFHKPYVKSSKLTDLTYTTRGHGTCNVIVTGRDVTEYVMQGLNRISSLY